VPFDTPKNILYVLKENLLGHKYNRMKYLKWNQ